MTSLSGIRWPWTAVAARFSRMHRPELIAAVVTAAVILPFILTPATAEGVEVTLDPESDTILLGETFTLTAIIDIPVDQFVTSIEIDVEGPASFTVPVPLLSGPFDLSNAPGVSGQLTGDVAFPADGFGYGYSFGYGYGYGDFEEESTFGYGYGFGFGDGFGSGYGYGYGDGAPGGPIVLMIQYAPVDPGSYTLRVRAITNLRNGPPITTEAEVTFTVVPLPPPPPPPPPPPGSKVTLCHIPPGNPGNAHLITVGAPAVKAHLRHGDVLSTTCLSLAKSDKSAPQASLALETTLCEPDDGGSVPAVLITVGAPTVKIHKAKDKAKGNASAATCSSSPDEDQTLSAAPADGADAVPTPRPVVGGGGNSKASKGGNGVGPSGNGPPSSKPAKGKGKGAEEPAGQPQAEADAPAPASQDDDEPAVAAASTAGGKGSSSDTGNGGGFVPPGQAKKSAGWLPPGLSKKLRVGAEQANGNLKVKGPPPGKGKGKGAPPGKSKGKKK